MSTPDASQYTTLKKYNAIDSRGDNGVKAFNHLYQPVFSVRRLIDFLPSFTNKNAFPFVVSLPNYPPKAKAKPTVPAGRPVVGGQH
jgi:hypothetical protein